MKIILALLTLLVSVNAVFCQKLEKNKENGLYESSTVIKFEDNKLIENLKSRLITLNYKITFTSDSLISASRTYSLGDLTGQDVTYTVNVTARPNRYRFVFTNFLVNVSSGQSTLEHLGFGITGLWVRNINKKLPQLISDLDLNNTKKKDDW